MQKVAVPVPQQCLPEVVINGGYRWLTSLTKIHATALL
jgi:hypothetical protein